MPLASDTSTPRATALIDNFIQISLILTRLIGRISDTTMTNRGLLPYNKQVKLAIYSHSEQIFFRPPP
jgi:hypothetical protein